MQILKLLENENIILERHGKNKLHGPCPFCGGTDRFIIYIDTERYWCNQCRRSGDAIQYLRDKHGMTYPAACSHLGMDTIPRHSNPERKPIRMQPKFNPSTAHTPTAQWMTRATGFIDYAAGCLWSDAGEPARAFLSSRGIDDEHLRAFHIGFNPQTIFDDRAAWGLPPELNDRGNHKKIWLPAGIVIPYHRDQHHPVRIRIRRDDADDARGRYIVAAGSTSEPMALCNECESWVVVESELDALTCNCAAGNVANIAAMGSAQAKPCDYLHGSLQAAERVLVALDAGQDETAGPVAAWNFWLKTYPNAKRWPPVFGKDIGEMAENGVDLGQWLDAA